MIGTAWHNTGVTIIFVWNDSGYALVIPIMVAPAFISRRTNHRALKTIPLFSNCIFTVSLISHLVISVHYYFQNFSNFIDLSYKRFHKLSIKFPFHVVSCHLLQTFYRQQNQISSISCRQLPGHDPSCHANHWGIWTTAVEKVQRLRINTAG